MSTRRMHRWLDSLGSASGAPRGGASETTARDIFRRRLEAASDANLTAIANRNDLIARKLEALRNATPQADAPVDAPADAPRETQNESEES